MTLLFEIWSPVGSSSISSLDKRRWQILVLLTGVLYWIGITHDAMAADPWLFSVAHVHPHFWSIVHTAYLRPYPLPLVVGETTTWETFIGWNSSSAIGLVFLGLLHLFLPLPRNSSDARIYLILLVVACLFLWFYALIACLYISYLPALVLAVAAIGSSSEFLNRWNSRIPATSATQTSPKERSPYSMLATVVAIGVSLPAFAHLIVALTYPEMFSPIDYRVFLKFHEALLSIPMHFGGQTTFWQAYIGSSITHGLTICTICLSTILCMRSHTFSRSFSVLQCLRGVGILLLLTTLIYSLWLSPIMFVAFPLSLMISCDLSGPEKVQSCSRKSAVLRARVEIAAG